MFFFGMFEFLIGIVDLMNEYDNDYLDMMFLC